MLVKHLRDDFKDPFATIVALDRDRIGLSICCPRDHFNKKRGVEIAKGRARYNCRPESPNRYVFVDNGEVYSVESMSEVIQREINIMKERAQKYFKEKQNVS